MTKALIGAASSALREQQHLLRQAIVLPAAADAARLLGRSASRIDIYRVAYTSRLTAALTDNFPVLRRVMGDADFEALAGAYIEAHPSRHPSIRCFGHRLAEFMAQDDERVAHPAFTDLARMEWALRGAFDAADAAVLTIEEVGALAPEAWPGLRFSLHPSVQWLDLRWAVEPAWRALNAFDADRDAEPELPAPAEEPHRLLVWRQGLETRWRSLDANEAPLLQALAAGERFDRLSELAAGQVGADEAAASVATALRRWLGDGLLSEVSAD